MKLPDRFGNCSRIAGTLLNVRFVLLKCRVSNECIDDNCLIKQITSKHPSNQSISTSIVHEQVDCYSILILVMMLIDAFVVVMYLK